MKKADELFEKQLYDEARREYEAVLAKSQGEERERALFRSVEADVLSFRYAQAAQKLLAEPTPEGGLPRARLLLLRAEVAREFLKQYGHGAPEDRQEGTTDVTRRTPDEWHAEVRRAYEALWAQRDELVARPLGQESYFVETKGADIAGTPTLWDFAVQRWTSYLLDETPNTGPKPDASRFVGDSFDGTVGGSVAFDAASPLVAAALFEDASRRPAAGRELAVELHRIYRLLIPFRANDRVRRAKKAGADETAAAATLKRWVDAFRESRSRADAAVEAATLLEGLRGYVDAVALCRRVEKEWPKAPAVARAAQLRERIEQPILGLKTRNAPPSGRPADGHGAVELTSRNVAEVHLRLYRTTEKELFTLRARGSDDRSQLRYLTDNAVTTFLKRSPVREWSVTPKPKAPHEPAVTAVDVSVEGTGLYVVVAGSDRRFPVGTSLVRGAVLNVTGFFLLGSASHFAGQGDAKPSARYYTLDGETGRPLAGVAIESLVRLNWSAVRTENASTDAEGQALLAAELKGDGTLFFDPIARREKDIAYWNQGSYFSVHREVPVELHLDMDRPIYRPGQKASVKVTALRRKGSALEVFGKGTVNLRLRDANYQKALEKNVPLNAMGSGVLSFDIPKGRLLGNYTVEAVLTAGGRGYHAQHGFVVEEYKRPEFELTLAEGKGAWKYGQPATVEGDAAYYFGGPVPEAKVTYKVVREPYIPFFCWWWRAWQLPWRRQEVAAGEVRTDAKGHFSFALTPERPETEGFGGAGAFPTRYTVDIEAHDAGGRTLTAQRIFVAGDQAYLFHVTPAAGFFTKGRDATAEIDVKNLNDQSVEAEGRFALHRLEGKPSAPAEETDGEEASGGDDAPPTMPDPSRVPSLDELFAKVPNGARVASGKFSTAPKRAATAELGKLEAGVYRLVLTTKDPWGTAIEQSRVVVVVDPARAAANPPLPSITAAEHERYVVGEKARVLLGSAELPHATFVEIWHGPRLVEVRRLGGGLQLVEVPVPAAARGGMTIRWHGVASHRVYRGETALTVPWKDRELALQWKVPEAFKPGDAVRGELQVKDADGRPVDGEATVRVYDRSLEYYAKSGSSWVSQLYPASGGPSLLSASLLTLQGTQLSVDRKWIEKLLDLQHRFGEAAQLLPPPAFRLQNGRVYGHVWAAPGGMRSGRHRFAMADAEAKMETSLAAPAAPPAARAKSAEGAGGGSSGPTNAAPPEPAPRSNFAETAYFGPQVPVKAGRATVAFTMPEQLTSWKIDATVVTKDVKHGLFEAKTATRKDLMVRVEIPRFFREKDKGVIRAVVHNETGAALKGTVTLALTAAEGAPKLTVDKPEQQFRAPAHGLVAVSWPVDLPVGTGTQTARLVARSGQLVDAEERSFPLLPSRERVVTSRLIALDGNQRRHIPAPEGLADVAVEAATLQIDPQLALPILRSIPFLVHYPCEATEAVVNRFVPLAVVSAIFKKYPELAKASAAKLGRKTRTVPWDREDPRRLTQLLETPWETESRGGSADPGRLISVLDPAVVEKERAAALERLQSYQQPSGAFPWFPGGNADPYLTLYVVAEMAELRNFDLPFPEPLVQKALAYAVSAMADRLKPDEGEVSLVLYAAYVLSAFADKPWAQPFLPAARSWLEFGDKHSRAMTAYGKALAAVSWWRLGEKARALPLLDRAVDGAQEDPVTGTFWAPEKISWLWYNDSLEKHAFFLRALALIRPDDKRIPGLVQWLLFNRKGNEWKSTKGSAAAVFSLLDVLKKRGALSRKETFHWSWAGEQGSVSVAASDPLSTPLRWTRGYPNGVTGAQAERAKGAQITKQGPGVAFASVTTRFVTDTPLARGDGDLLRVERTFFRREAEGVGRYKLSKLDAGATVKVGDEIEAHYAVTTRSQFQYVQLKAPRGAGFEASELRSGWRWDDIGRYEETRDTLSNFYFDWVPHGEYVLKHRWRATTPGAFRIPSAQLQSIYSPEMAGFSSGFMLNVAKD